MAKPLCFVARPFGQKSAEGTGLGLAIVKRAIDLHQGNISLTSQPGIGTTIRVELPIITN